MNEILPRCPHNLRNALRELHRSSHREDVRQFIVEGPHACGDLLQANILPIAVILRDDATQDSQFISRGFSALGVDVFACGAKDMELMADASAPQDILILARYFFERPVGSRVVVLDGVSDPGNVGSIIRSACWFGCTDVVLGEGCADVYNPKVVRSSAGALTRVNILRRQSLIELVATLVDRPIIAAVAHGGGSSNQLQGLKSFAIMIGSEAHGLQRALIDLATVRVTIPGGNGTESLNAAIATSIMLYEATK